MSLACDDAFVAGFCHRAILGHQRQCCYQRQQPSVKRHR